MRRKRFWSMAISVLGVIFGLGMIVLNSLALAVARFAMIFGTPESEMSQIFWIRIGLGIAIVVFFGFLTSAGVAFWWNDGESSQNAS